MRHWGARLAVLILLLAVGLWAWRYFFPSPERVIRERLTELARIASFSGQEPETAKLLNAKKIANFCTSDVEVSVNADGYRQHLSNREELFNLLLFIRTQMSEVSLQFVDLDISFAPNKEAAVVSLTVRGRIPTDKDMIVQECKFTLKKMGRSWLIRKIETVKTLS